MLKVLRKASSSFNMMDRHRGDRDNKGQEQPQVQTVSTPPTTVLTEDHHRHRYPASLSVRPLSAQTTGLSRPRLHPSLFSPSVSSSSAAAAGSRSTSAPTPIASTFHIHKDLPPIPTRRVSSSRPAYYRRPPHRDGRGGSPADVDSDHPAGANEDDEEVILDICRREYRDAVKLLFAEVDNRVSAAGDEFLIGDDIRALFDSATDGDGVPITPQMRFGKVLQNLLPHLRNTFSNRDITQKVSHALALENQIAEALLTQWVHAPGFEPTQPAIVAFRARTFADSSPNVPIRRVAFRDQFATFTLLHKIALTVKKFQITARQLPWLFAYRQRDGDPTAEWLDMNALPLTLDGGAGGNIRFVGWERLRSLFKLRDSLPMGEITLDAVFAQVRTPTVSQAATLSTLEALVKWKAEDVATLVGPQGFNLAFPADYKDERALLRVAQSLALLNRLGMPVTSCLSLAETTAMDDPVGAERIARATNQAVKAKYDQSMWETLAPPLCNILRDKQRTALVDYLVARPARPGAPFWRHSNDLFAHFLLDVEMGSCQTTSRIKQALCSIQLFVQRCLMNLEDDVKANTEVDPRWNEWKRMKSYSTWLPALQTFLRPESLMEPELRDDKSPFFVDLQSELQQQDVTKDAAEAAFLHYLEKLDATARMTVVGLYHQEESDLSDHKVVDVLHVFARTRGKPPAYYYRQRVDASYWTAWEKVDVEIEGDHLIPVVWNRRLYLFWPIFMKKQKEASIQLPKPGDTLDKGEMFWEIKMAWSEYKNKKWLAKAISHDYLRLAIDSGSVDAEIEQKGKSLLTFRTSIDGPAKSLSITCFQETGLGLHQLVGQFHFDGCNSSPLAVAPAQQRTSFVVRPRNTHTNYMSFAAESEPEDAVAWEAKDTIEHADKATALYASSLDDSRSFSFHPHSSDSQVQLLAKAPPSSA